MRTPYKAIFLAQLLADAGPKGLSRKEMVTALLKSNGHAWSPRRSGYGSIAFFTPNPLGVGGVYWNNYHADRRYRLTKAGVELADTGKIASKAQRSAALRKSRARKIAKLPPIPQPLEPNNLHQRQLHMLINALGEQTFAAAMVAAHNKTLGYAH